VSPAPVWNDGHEINAIPDAGVPSARYTGPLTVVSTGPCARNVSGTFIAIINVTTSTTQI
jgi:hypothetical protein